MKKRVPPQNIDAEQSVLGAMMIKKEALAEVQEILHPHDFYREAHRLVYETMLELFNARQAVDLVTVTEALQKKDMLDKVGGVAFISALGNAVPTAANLSFHAKIVKEKAQLRNLINAATSIAETAYDDNEEIADIFDSAEKTILGVTSNQSSGDFTSTKEIVMAVIEKLEAIADVQGGITGLPSGFRDLDQKTSGFQESDLILVAARPSMGKTAFTLNICANAALRYDKTVAFFSLEMAKEQLVQRMMCSEAAIDSQRMRTGQMDDDEWESLVLNAGDIAMAPIYIDDTPGITVMELRSKARRLKTEKGLDLIIIDYLQLMQGRRSVNSDNRQQEISEISRSLKALARELKVPVIALSQLSRSVESRTIKRPMLSDLRESGSLEQDADIVMFLYREDYYDQDTENKNITELIISKNRNGPVDTVRMFFQKEYTRFRDLAQGDPGYGEQQ